MRAAPRRALRPGAAHPVGRRERRTAAGGVVILRGSEPVTVRICPEGPLLVRGAESVVDGDGTAHRVTRPVVAVCACDKSSRMPWCDSTHKALQRGAGQ